MTTKRTEPGKEAFMTMLRRYRLSKGMSQQKLAKKLHVTHATVSQWESKGAKPHPKRYIKLAAFLGVDPMKLTKIIDPANG